MFSKLLIANRGEIARRIARTARRLGIATVAVYPTPMQRHCVLAEEAWHIGPAPAEESYLRIERLIEVARLRCRSDTLATASENAAFAEACAAAGLPARHPNHPRHGLQERSQEHHGVPLYRWSPAITEGSGAGAPGRRGSSIGFPA